LRLEGAELVPFATAVAVAMPTIMTAHILLPQIDPENPASLSRIVIHGILRRHMGFRGVILADDLGMGAIARRYAPGEAAVQTLIAGTDIAMLCHDWSAVAPSIAAVEKARQENLFDPDEWDASLRRIELTCALTDFPEPQPPIDAIGCEKHRTLAAKIKALLI
jgi:beta-N-acetylhexosaminidase